VKMTREELRQRIDDMDEATFQKLVLVSIWSDKIHVSSLVSDDAARPMRQAKEEDQGADIVFYFRN